MNSSAIRRLGPTMVTILILAGALALGVLQYRWVSVSSAADEARTRALISQGASQVALDAAFEVRVPLSLARVDADELAASNWSSITTSLAVWYANAPFPDLLSAVYIVRDVTGKDVVGWDRAAGRFTPAVLPVAVRTALASSLATSGGRRAWNNIALQGSTSAVVLPVTTGDQGRPGAAVGAVVVVMDEGIVYSRIVPYYMKRNLADYGYRIVSTVDGTVFAASDASLVRRAPEITVAVENLQPDDGRPDGPVPGRGGGAGGSFTSDPLLQSWLQRVQGGADSSLAVPPQVTSDVQLMVYYPGRTLADAIRAQQVLTLLVAFALLGFLAASAVILGRMYRRNALLRASEQQFVASISHELRTPIAVIQATSENLSKGVVTDPSRLPRYAEVINSQIRRLSGMVEGILLYSGLQSGRARTPGMAPVDVSALIRETLVPLEHVASERGSSMHLTLESLPPTSCTDPMAVRLVVENLVMNAIRHADPGEIKVTAGLRAFDTLRITVEDGGPGIPGREQSRVFEPFVRGERSAAAQVPGSGLGLHLVRRVAGLLGGRVELESPYTGIAGKAQKGCRFVVTLPCREACDEG